MSTAAHRQVRVHESSQPSEARSVARELAQSAGLDETDAYRASIVASELATNLTKYATDGELLLRTIGDGDAKGVEVLSIDRGPGLPDVGLAMRDGHSTGGSAGTGLGAVRRLSEEFDIATGPRGTIVLSRVHAGRRAAAATPFVVGAVSVAVACEEPCGDSWAVRRHGRLVNALVVDGLGHGVFAAEAARAAVDTWTSDRFPGIPDALAGIHDGLKHTRGAAAAIVEIDPDARVLRFGGVGNIAASIVPPSGRPRQAVSHNGTLGHQARVFREFQYPWDGDNLVVVHSDGLTSHWSLDAYPGLARRHPAIVAGVLYRDFSRGRDDVTVLVCREGA
ncbi:MAG TPA: ATP-binding SpoIIE family protein phosphatase [Vicinamibacterales bacterium]|nr:ATP-binding SpoIIE family protein phosphatase [Vicinamibacterales bacterium]